MSSIFLKKVMNKLINKEFKRIEFAKKHFSLPQLKKKIFPCITVSRETGSGGRLVATLVAKKLRIKYYDKQFVELIARSTKKRTGVVKSLDEKNRSMIEGIISSLGSPSNKMSESYYFRHLCRTILSLAGKGKAVILGRGANFIIPAERCLSVRIIAPLKTRIESAIKFEKKSPLKAREDIRRIHYSRKEFIKRYFQKNISNANYYDLVINTKYITLDQAISLIIKAFKEKFPKA